MSTARLAAFRADGRTRCGAITGKDVLDLSGRYGAKGPTLREVIAAGKLNGLAEEAEGLPADFGLDDIAFEIPVPSPEKIVCVGVNDPDRNDEHKDGQAAPANPSLFLRFPRSFVGHRQPLIRPPESPQLDYEGEVVIVIGTPTGVGARLDPPVWLKSGDLVEAEGIGILRNGVVEEAIVQ